MAFRNGMLVFMAAALAAACWPAHAGPGKPECRDPPPVDPVANTESLPTHEQVTQYLMDERRRAHFSCTSTTLAYEGTREGKGIRVVSRYRAGGAIHAETYAQRDTEIGGWRKHGIVRIRRRDGAVQALEYYCRGFEVGFHRYFGDNGELRAIADYTHSDYEWQKPIPSATYREFYRGSSRLGSVSTGLQSDHRFREVYRVQGDRAERVSFSAATSFGSSWEALDLTSTVKDWTEPGMQGAVSLYNQPWQIRNFDFQYLSFAEVYQRKRLGVPGARAPTEYNASLLECPWIDEAMAPGLEDPRFKLETPATLTDAERAESPAQRLDSCLRAPTVNCLLESALVGARRAQPLQGEQMRNYADDALTAGQPALARAAMEEVLASRWGYLPNTSVARQGAIKAQAEAAMGLRDDVLTSARAAFANAMGPNTHAAGRDVGALEAVGLRLARAGAIDEAGAAFHAVPMAYAEEASLTLEEIALAQIRSGDISGARETLAELTQIGAQAGLPEPDAILEVAAAQAERGDTPAAAATLERLVIPANFPPPLVTSLNAKAAAIRARFPSSETLSASIEQALAGTDLASWIAVVSAYCELGNTAQGVKVLQQARLNLRRPSAEQIADLGAAEATCGRPDRARADFAQARRVIGRMSPDRSGDLIPDPIDSARAHLRMRMVDAGLIDELPDGKDEQPEEFAIAFAAQRAEHGSAENALSVLDAIRIEGPDRDDLRQRQMLLRAHVLRLLSRNDEAEAELVRARQLALAQDAPGLRVTLLVHLAEARLRDKQPERAKESLDEAQAALLADFVRPGTWRTPAGSGMISLARARAAAGDDAAAMKLIGPGRRQMKFQAVAARAADRVNGEIAVAQARTGAVSESLASLRKIETTPWRIWYLSRVTAIAEKRADEKLLAAVASLRAAMLTQSQQTIESARDMDERRRVYHAYLATLRGSHLPGTEEQRAQTLESLHRNLDLFTNVGERARAACELAFTYEHLGQSAVAATQFSAAQSLQSQPGTRREAGGPPLPAGACVYWMSSTPMNSQARSEMDRIVEARRSWAQSNNGMTRPEQALQELALIVSESQAGEIDWETGTRFTTE